MRYVSLDEIWERSDIASLNCPLTAETYHLVSHDVVARLKPGVMLVNTGRGALVDTVAVIEGLKSGRIGSVALDVYEEEAPLFFEDRSSEVLTDDVFARLLTFPNVLVTAHQAFLRERGPGRHRRDDARQPRRPRGRPLRANAVVPDVR
ncbi:MAG: NAD(P)-dependent oxidoreductase [Ilumatobacteraceae bacterium]